MIQNVMLFLVFSLLLGCTTLFDNRPKIDSSEVRAVYVIARKEGFKHIRHTLKSQVKGEYQNHLSYDEYNNFQYRIAQIHGIGESFRTINESEVNYQATTMYNEVFQKTGYDTEESYDLMKWGPILVNDEGMFVLIFVHSMTL